MRLLESGGQSLRSVKERLALEAGAGYLELLGARRQVRINERSVEVAREHHRHLLALHETGLATYDEVLKAEVHLEQARIKLAAGRNRVELARAQLLERMGLPSGSGFTFADTCDDLPVPQVSDRTVDRALNLRPVLAGYHSRIASLEAVAASLNADNLPTVSLFVTGTAARPGIDMFRKEFIEYARAGVVMDWKVWDWGAKSNRLARIEARKRELAAEKTDLERRIALELERESLWEKEAEDRLGLAQKALTAAREHFRLVGERFDQGQVTNTEYIDSQEEAAASELEVSRAEIDLALARWRLAYVCGLLTVELDRRFGPENIDNDEEIER
jgi:outer membrane protein TolC